MIPVITIISLIEAVTALAQVGISTVNAIEKLKNGKPDEVDVTELKKVLLSLPDLSTLYPPEIPTETEDKDSN